MMFVELDDARAVVELDLAELDEVEAGVVALLPEKVDHDVAERRLEHHRH